MILIIGFDSAWSENNQGALSGILQNSSGDQLFLGNEIVNFVEAKNLIDRWVSKHKPLKTLIMIDQPNVVTNQTGRRPVDMAICHTICRSKGGIQPANLSQVHMFGPNSGLGKFLNLYPDHYSSFSNFKNEKYGTWIIETYPVMTIIGFLFPFSNRLPKYNPQRKNTFDHIDFIMLATILEMHFQDLNLNACADELSKLKNILTIKKHDQDKLDSLICLFVGYLLVNGPEDLNINIGDQKSGSITFPCSVEKEKEIIQDIEIHSYDVKTKRV